MDSTPPNPRPSATSSARTPLNRPSTVEPPSNRRAAVHTPLHRASSHDVNSARRGATPHLFNNAPTPHAKAARRALNDRRTAMFTPGKNRRQSQMEQRETAMDILRNLGKALAPKSKPIVSSSSEASADDGPPTQRRTPASRSRLSRDRLSGPPSTIGRYSDDDDSDGPLPKRPRLSLPIDRDDDEDEPDLRPPRISDITVASVEGPRRYDPDQGLPRESIGSLHGTILGDNEPTIVGRQSDFFPVDNGSDPAAGDYERIDDDPARRSSIAQGSDFGFELPGLEEPSMTFQFSPPAIDPEPSSMFEDAMAIDAAVDPTEDVEPIEPVADIPSDREPLEDIPSREASEEIPDPDPDPFGGDVSDREPFEDIPEPDDAMSDEGGITMGEDRPSDTAARAEMTRDVTAPQEVIRPRREAMPARKKSRISRFGIEYPSLPPTFVKKVAQTALQSSGLSNPRISADTLAALTQASEWFFEQLGDDLGAYASHAKRKTIEESDVITLMRRQRQIGSTSTMFSLAQKHLPRELLQELRMPLPHPTRKLKEKRSREDEEDEEDKEEANV